MLMSGGEILRSCLEKEQVKYVWGMTGHSNIAAADALIESDIRYIGVRHEQVAAHSADAYFRVTRQPGVLLVHNAPGMTNALTGIGDAAADCSAMVIFCGDVPTHHFGKDCFQEIGMNGDAAQYEIYKPLVKRAWRVSNLMQLPGIIARAFHIAMSGRPGPVFVSVPLEMWSKKLEFDPENYKSLRICSARSRGDFEGIKKAAELLLDAKNPVIHVGGGGALSGASAEILALADYLGIPVTTTMAGKGVIPEDHLLSLGTTGRAGTVLANDFCKNADVILALGTRFPEQDSGSWIYGGTFNFPPTKLIQVDIIEQEIGKIYPAEIGIVGDVKSVVQDLLEYIKQNVAQRDWKNTEKFQEITNRREDWIKEISKNLNLQVPIHPEFLLKEVRKALPKDGVVLGDVGWSKNGVCQQFTAYLPDTVLVAAGFGTMGFAAGAALGAKIGAGDRAVISLTGDGGFSACIPAVVTAVENKIPAVWIVFNNGCYSAIRLLQERHFHRTIGTKFNTPDGEKYDINWAEMAKVFGAKGRRITEPAELADAIKEAISANEPYVLDVVVNPDATVKTFGSWDVHDIYDGKLTY